MGAVEPVANAVVELLIDERFEEVAGRFAAGLRAAVSAWALRAAWATAVAAHGPAVLAGTAAVEPVQAGLVQVRVPVGGFDVVMSVGEDGLVHGLRLTPAADSVWTPPSYADPSAFTEREITLGAAGATVTAPVAGCGAGVVLLAGGGPFDRDETSGPNKPLKDLAWGLAGRGVAVVRFDKLTHEHAAGFTMTDEYVPFALEALDVLRRQPGVTRVFVAGHSMGGKVAPRVAEADPAVAGLVILAGDAQPMHHAAVRVARYLGLDGSIVERFARQASLVDSARLTSRTPSADLPFGWPASYWLDLRGYDPVATTARLTTPVFLAQGGRDYQVTVADDLSCWLAGLTGRPGVTSKVYETADHLFMPGQGRSTAADYARPGHVDAAVVADVAEWVARTGA
ncbi:S9 family peptidase [Amycolatopsis sp. FDAARGOS 1241]|uniref:alpha/beta hydrolase family protein n=1 Tax=Amycolatopsis sp. FDAARGOS 1241 TaxID=2778070 RepID=UPI00194FEB9E|nr:alpha/beta hydrolase [Amycolatopsis sp. FDAARGOS 1241]QRP50073.1 alpha/beta hydrolase [Amycolatopsis sp. FDAARGOS 1241]